jgi:hypothetical protein
MTIAEMHDTIKTLRDLYKAPYYDANEIDIFINSAISAFILSSIPDPKKGQKQNVESQKTWDQLATLITNFTTTSFTTVGVNDVVFLATSSFAKPSNFQFYYAASCIIGNKQAVVNVVDYNELSGLIEDAFNEPNDLEVKLIFINNQIYIISKTVPAKIILYYIKEPNIVSLDNGIDCNLPKSVHDKICHMAVQISCGGSNLLELYKIQENEITKR